MSGRISEIHDIYYFTKLQQSHFYDGSVELKKKSRTRGYHKQRIFLRGMLNQIDATSMRQIRVQLCLIVRTAMHRFIGRVSRVCFMRKCKLAKAQCWYLVCRVCLCVHRSKAYFSLNRSNQI